MRIKLLPSLLIAILAIAILPSCSKKTNTQGRYVPEDALFVFHLNGQSLNEKLPWEEVKANKAFTLLQSDSTLDALTKAALDNPENTGIDIKSDLLVFVAKDSLGGYAAFEGKLKDAAKFKTYFTSVLKDAVASQKDGIDFLTKEKISVSWNKEKFVALVDIPEMNKLNELSQSNSLDTAAITTAPQPALRNSNQTAAALYNLPQDKSLGSEERFSYMINDKADMHFWMNVEAFYSNMQGMEAMAMTMFNFKKLYEDSRLAASANFENGKMVADLITYNSKEALKIFKKYSGNNISNELAAKLPSKEPAVFFAMNYKPEGILEYLKLAGMDGLMNMAMAFIGFGTEDIAKAFKGDFQLSISDFKTDSFGLAKPTVLASATIKDKASLSKILVAANKATQNEGNGFAFSQNDQYVVFGNNKAATDAFINAKANNLPAFWDKIKNNALGGFVDLQILMNSFKHEARKDSLEMEAFNKSLAFWDDVVFTGGNIKNNGIAQHIEVNLMDKNSNSLKQLNKYIDAMAQIAKKQKERYQIDDVTVLPAPAEDAEAIKVDTVVSPK